MHAGIAPIPVSSGRTDHHRLCRGGNLQLNAAIHRIAITQLRMPGPGQSYYLGGELKKRASCAPTCTSTRFKA
jgi:transposase